MVAPAKLAVEPREGDGAVAELFQLQADRGGPPPARQEQEKDEGGCERSDQAGNTPVDR